MWRLCGGALGYNNDSLRTADAIVRHSRRRFILARGWIIMVGKRLILMKECEDQL